MRWTKAFIPTLKEKPKEARTSSHALLLKAGMIRPLGSGAYSYLPLGWRSLKKTEQIVREEMDRAGAQELLMPALQPVSLWRETGRDEDLKEVMIRFRDRHGKDYAFGPTHEEVVTDIVRNSVRSYRELPFNLYQIQTKFRDEERPRAGVIRTREFIMKDAYSFDADEQGLEESYRKMYDAYVRIYRRSGLSALPVEAESGAMGGKVSHEFMVLCSAGEDSVAACEACGYAANLERCECRPTEPVPPGTSERKLVSTPGARTIEQVCSLLSEKPSRLLKTLIYLHNGRPVAVLVRGDHEANESKLKRALGEGELSLADAETIGRATRAPVGFAGPVGLELSMIADHAVAAMVDLVTGANAADAHFTGVNRVRDFPEPRYADIRTATDGDGCPRCGGSLRIKRAIEVGHVFKLGTRYSDSMKARFLDAEGKEKPFVMGCYGIGVNRILAAAVEEHHDENGILWPVSLAPYEVVLLSIDESNARVKEVSERLYSGLSDAGVEVLYDDRNVRPGVKFKDADLIGFPLRLTVGERNLKKGQVELKRRDAEALELVAVEGAVERTRDIIRGTFAGLAAEGG